MQSSSKESLELKRRFDLLMNTPASFDFFLAIHDFVEQIERHSAFPRLKLTAKYVQLKQIYQGLEDSAIKTDSDLGHDRYMMIQDLLRIKQRDVSDSNPIWKKRDVLRTICADTHGLLKSLENSESLA